MRDRLWGGLIGTSSAVIASVIILWITGAIANAQAMKNSINSKVSIEEFEKHKEEELKKYEELKRDSEKQLDDFKNHVDKRIDDTQTLIIELNKASRD